MIVRFHKFQTKDLIIRAAHKHRGELKYRDKPVYIYEDYCPEVMEQHAEYKEVMSQLYSHNIGPSLLYSARLRLVTTGVDGVSHQ